MEEEPPSLHNLPNCTILTIFHYLDASTLYNLSRTCRRFEDFVKQHRSLWQRIDARTPPNDIDKATFCTERIYKNTNSVLFWGERCEVLVSERFYYNTNNFGNIRILALENQKICSSRYSITTFPENLEELSLRQTEVEDGLKFMRQSHQHMKKLRVLILDGCKWVVVACFVPISKYPSLEIFSVYKCPRVEDMVAYLSFAGNLGFKHLKVLDARLSTLGNTLFQTFYKSNTLLGIYFQNFDVTYKLDYFKRRLAIANGAKSHSPNLPETEPEMKPQSILDPVELDDRGLVDYLTAISTRTKEKWPKSHLYTYPYNSCICQKQNENNSRSGSKSDDDDDDDDDNLKPKLQKDIKQLQKSIKNGKNLEQFIRPSGPPRPIPEVIINLPHGPCGTLRAEYIASAVRAEQELFCRDHNSDNEARSESDEDSPPHKRQRLDCDNEPVAGPSNNGPVPRPPTPHPNYDDQEFINMLNPLIRIVNVEYLPRNNIIPLRQLSLRGFKKITNNALHYLQGVDLDILDLTYTSCTVNAINEYLQLHPNCRIVHEKFCVCAPNLHF